MTQSSDSTFTINLDEDYLNDTGSEYTYNLSSTVDTTTYSLSDSIGDITFDTTTYDGTFTIDTNTVDTVNIDWIYNNMNIDPSEVERMCKEYPSLEKVWRNFKSVYDMVKQDYEGKKKAGEIDDDIPF